MSLKLKIGNLDAGIALYIVFSIPGPIGSQMTPCLYPLIMSFVGPAGFETDFLAIVYNDASTSNQNVSSEPTVCIYNAIKSDIDFYISFSDSEDEDYTFIYNKDSSSYTLIPANDLKPEPVNNYVEINIESCLENIDVKPMDSVICTSNDTTPIEFDKNIETNHDTPDLHTANYGVICEDEAKRRNSGTKTKIFEENCYLLLYVVSSKEDTAYQRQLITRIRVMINSRFGVSLLTHTPYAQLVISQRYAVNVIDGN
ncbi:hypothetical protein Tco_0098288 [Tanacetum coccineum]